MHIWIFVILSILLGVFTLMLAGIHLCGKQYRWSARLFCVYSLVYVVYGSLIFLKDPI